MNRAQKKILRRALQCGLSSIRTHYADDTDYSTDLKWAREALKTLRTMKPDKPDKARDALQRIANSCEEFTTDKNCDADPYDLMQAFLTDAREVLASASA